MAEQYERCWKCSGTGKTGGHDGQPQIDCFVCGGSGVGALLVEESDDPQRPSFEEWASVLEEYEVLRLERKEMEAREKKVKERIDRMLSLAADESKYEIYGFVIQRRFYEKGQISYKNAHADLLDGDKELIKEHLADFHGKPYSTLNIDRVPQGYIMSTYWADLKEPFSSIYVHGRDICHVVIFKIEDEPVGTMIIDNRKLAEVIRCFASEDYIGYVSATSDGPVYTQLKRPRTDCIINEYGEIWSYKLLLETYSQKP